MDANLVAGETRRWWREPQLAVLALIVIGIYFTRLTALSIRGEESRRARVAVEILESGDWIVPTQQRQIYLSRPPLGSYPIALLGLLRERVDLVAVRLPTVTAVLLTSVLIYGYARTFLSANGAMGSALAFATMGQVLELGRLAETEATFTLLVACSLLLWHWGYSRGWPHWVAWSVGYTSCALAGLAKGPQGPIYFVAATTAFLLLKRDWKMLFGGAHGIGLLAFAAVLAAWQIPYFLKTNLECSIGIWVNNAAKRFVENDRPGLFIRHLATYPLELLGCMLPWSLLLWRYGDRRLLATLGPARSNVQFLVTAIVVTFPSVWLAGTARGRYFMPLYPCFAVLVGIVVDRCLTSEPRSHLRTIWHRYSLLLAGALAISAAAVGVATWMPLKALEPIAQPKLFALAYILCVIAGITAVFRWHLRPATGLVTIAMLLGLTYSGVVVNAYAKQANDPSGAIAAIKQKIGSGEQLASFDRVDHMFAYLYELPIVYHPVPRSEQEARDVQYFVIDGRPKPVVELPFAWEEVATIVLDRNKMAKPKRTAIVGRRIGHIVADQSTKSQAIIGAKR